MKEKKERNEQLYKDWKSGMSYYSLGEKYGMRQPVAFRKVRRMKKLEEMEKAKQI